MRQILWSALSYGPRVTLVEAPSAGAAVALQRAALPGDYSIEALGPDDAGGTHRLGLAVLELIGATGLPSADLLAVEAGDAQFEDGRERLARGERALRLMPDEWEAVRLAVRYAVRGGAMRPMPHDEALLDLVLSRMAGP